MREIKFRAWGQGLDAGYWVEDFYVYQDGSIAVDEGIYGEKEEKYITENVVLMYYTGLKDKNGKDVYEGDILADTDNPEEHYILGKVAYNQIPDCIYAGQYLLEDNEGYASEWDIITGEGWHKLEVIGNIYENPELMEVI